MLTRTVLTKPLCDVRWHCLSACDLTAISCDLPLFVLPLLLHHGLTRNRIVLSIISGGWSVLQGNQLPGISPPLIPWFYATCQYWQTFACNVITLSLYPLELKIHVFPMFWTRVSGATFLPPPPPNYCSYSKPHVLKFVARTFIVVFSIISKSDYLPRRVCHSFCLSPCLKPLFSKRTHFYDISYFSIFRKSVDESQVSLKSDKNNGYFTWRLMYIYVNPLQTKRRPLYLKTQSVPRCKHFSSRL